MDSSNEGTLKNISNAGGKILLGNYVEDRYANECLHEKTNYSDGTSNKALDLRGGNRGAVLPDATTTTFNSTQREDFKPVPATAMDTECRLDALMTSMLRADAQNAARVF